MDTQEALLQSQMPVIGKAEKSVATKLVTAKGRSGHRISQQTITDKSLPETKEEAIKGDKTETTRPVTPSRKINPEKAKPVISLTTTTTDSFGASTEKYPPIPQEPEIIIESLPISPTSSSTASPKSNRANVVPLPPAQSSSGSSTAKYHRIPGEPEEVITGQSAGKNAEQEHIVVEIFDSPSTSTRSARHQSATKVAKNLALAPFHWFQSRFGYFGTTGKRDRVPTNDENNADMGVSGSIGKMDATPTNNENSADKSSAPMLNNALAQYLKLEDDTDKQTLKDEMLKIIQNTTGIDYQDSNGNTPLHLAVATQDLEIVAAIKAQNPNLKKQNNQKRTALHEASALCNSDILPLLIPEGRNHCQSSDPRQTDFINHPDFSDLSPLSISLIHGKPDMTLALIKLGANPALKDKFGRTALHQAALFGAEHCIDTLLESTPGLIDDTDLERCTALHSACLLGQSGIVEKITNSSLFDCRKHLDVQNKDGRTPIACAVYGQNLSCMETLIDKGANVDIQDSKGHSLVAQACLSSDLPGSSDKAVNNIVNALMARGVKTTTVTHEGLSCLHLAAQTDNVELFKLLLNAGLDPTLQDNIGRTPLHHAASCASAGIVQLLLSTKGVSANTTAWLGTLPLHYACGLDQKETLKLESMNATIRQLLKKTVNPNTQDSSGQTPLITACLYGNKEIIRELLRDDRVNPNFPDKYRVAPLFLVVRRIMKNWGNKDDNIAVMALLLKSRADANARTPTGLTLLNNCIKTDVPAVVKTLLRGAGDGIDVNLANRSDGWRPLVDACFLLTDPYDTVKELLVRKADPRLGNVVIENNQASNDWTALHAIFFPYAGVKKPEERWKVAKLLMDHKASPYQPSRKYNDCTPLHVAINDLANEKLAIQMIEHTPPRKQDLMLRAHGLTAAQMAGKNGLFLLQKLLTEKMT